MKSRFIVLLILSFFTLVQNLSFANELRCASVFHSTDNDSETSNLILVQTPKISEIKKTEKALLNNSFTTSRDLGEYLSIFKAKSEKTTQQHFAGKLSSLRSSDRWLDSGAGRAYAQKTFLNNFKNKEESPELVALSLKKPLFLLPVFSKKFKYISGKWLEEITKEDIGTFQLITDLFGPMTYSQDPILVLNKYLELLSENGEAYITLENRSNLVDKNGKPESLVEWLIEKAKNQTDFEIEIINYSSFRIHLHRTTNFRWPALKLTRFISELPPFRRFEELDNLN